MRNPRRAGQQIPTGKTALKVPRAIAEVEAAELRAKRDQAAAQLAELEAGPRKEEIAAAKHDWEALIAELEQARLEAKRAEALFAQKTQSETEHDQALTRARTLEKNAAAAKSRYDWPKLTSNCAK